MNSHKTFKKLLICIAGSLLTGLCHAQYSYSGTATSVITVPKVINIELANKDENEIEFSSTNNFSNGITIQNFATIKIRGNVSWAFGVSTTTQHFIASGNYASHNMPSQVLGVRLSNTQTQYLPLSTTIQTLKTGSKGKADDPGNTFSLDLLADPKYDYGPGIYYITINYTLTAQ